MADRAWKVLATRPILFVSDIERAVAFYGRIGFEETFRNDVVYAVLKFGELYVHLGTKMEHEEGVGGSKALIEMEEIDDYYALCVAEGATIARELADQFYGLRSFNLQDPDGNVIEFAEVISR